MNENDADLSAISASIGGAPDDKIYRLKVYRAINGNCTNCVYSRKNDSALNAYLCFRYPPKVDMVMIQSPAGPKPGGTISYRPGVTEKDVCGEYLQADSV